MTSEESTLKVEHAAGPRGVGIWRAVGLLAVLLGIALGGRVGMHQYLDMQLDDVWVDTTWNQVMQQYTIRSELVPSLVSLVKSHAPDEQDIYNQVGATRATLSSMSAMPMRGADDGRMGQFQATQNQLAEQMSRVLQLAEKYPALKSSPQFADMTVLLEGTERRLVASRHEYAARVTAYNAATRRFPGNLIASQVGFEERPVSSIKDQAIVLRPVIMANK